MKRRCTIDSYFKGCVIPKNYELWLPDELVMLILKCLIHLHQYCVEEVIALISVSKQFKSVFNKITDRVIWEPLFLKLRPEYVWITDSRSLTNNGELFKNLLFTLRIVERIERRILHMLYHEVWFDDKYNAYSIGIRTRFPDTMIISMRVIRMKDDNKHRYMTSLLYRMWYVVNQMYYFFCSLEDLLKQDRAHFSRNNYTIAKDVTRHFIPIHDGIKRPHVYIHNTNKYLA